MSDRRKERLILFGIAVCCFALWGVNSEMTEPMSRAYSKVFIKDTSLSPALHVFYYAAYALMTIPAIIVSRRLGARAGLLTGLGLFAAGALSHLPASQIGSYTPFMVGLFAMTCGVAFLETSANPLVITMGRRDRALNRLFLAQTFNVAGWIGGYLIMTKFIDRRLFVLSAEQRIHLDPIYFEAAQKTDLLTIATPFVWIGAAACALAIATAMMEIYSTEADAPREHTAGHIVRTLAGDKAYVAGVACLFLYVGAQTIGWSSIVGYGTATLMASPGEGTLIQAADVAKGMLLPGLLAFGAGRLLAFFLTRRDGVRPTLMLGLAAALASALTVTGVCLSNEKGLWCMIGVSGCMSVMYPTIFHLATKDLDNETLSVAAAGLVMAGSGGLAANIVGWEMDDTGTLGLLMAAAAFAVIAGYAAWCAKRDKKKAEAKERDETPDIETEDIDG